MTSWSSDWEPAARSALVALRGQGTLDARGLPIPALSVTDAISTLSFVVQPIINQLIRCTGLPIAVAADYVDAGGNLTVSTVQALAAQSNIPVKAYLAGYPSPDTSQHAWNRSPTQYTDAEEFGRKCDAGNYDAGVYTIYTSDGQSGQIVECRQLVDSYQAACNAIASGASTQADMSLTMSDFALSAFWSAILQITASLDVLAEIPPPPPLSQALAATLQETANKLSAGAEQIADAVGQGAAKIANLAGNVAGNAAHGLLEGIGLPGMAVIVGVLAIAIAMR